MKKDCPPSPQGKNPASVPVKQAAGKKISPTELAKLTGLQALLLAELYRYEKAAGLYPYYTCKEVAKWLQVHHRTIRRTLKELEKAGYIERAYLKDIFGFPGYAFSVKVAPLLQLQGKGIAPSPEILPDFIGPLKQLPLPWKSQRGISFGTLCQKMSVPLKQGADESPSKDLLLF
jgi:hypothetical protein